MPDLVWPWVWVAAALTAVACAPAAAASGGPVQGVDGLGGVSLPLLEPPARLDPSDAGAGPLDVRSVTFGQRGTEMVLRLRTSGAWHPQDLGGRTGRSLCLRLSVPPASAPRGRLCVTATPDGEAGLRYARLTPAGRAIDAGLLDAAVSQPSGRELEAVFTPGAADLPLGRFAWRFTARWPAGATACTAAACRDDVPDQAPARTRVVLLARPRCFGAAARPRHGRCRNPKLARVVFPLPQDALLMPNQFCLPTEQRGELVVCRFRTPPRSERARTVALIGDSHASHWRAALNIVATARQWRGVSLTHTGCPFSNATPRIPRPERLACATWRAQVVRWLRRHREVHTVFISNHTGGVLTPPGANPTAVKIDGYLRALRSIPRSVRRVVVIRDNPMFTPGTAACVTRAARSRRAGSRCALARRRALPLDPSRIAAERRAATSRRFRVVDMPPSFCSRRFCFPVIGGALVNKDTGHLTETYSATLGPVLLRKLSKLR